MGQMKKLYEMENALVERAGVFYMNRTAKLQIACNDALDRIRTAEYLIGDYLSEGYVTDLYAARSILQDAINLLEDANGSTNRPSPEAADCGGEGSQDRRSHEDGDNPRPSHAA